MFKKRLVPGSARRPTRRGGATAGDASLEMLRVAELLEESDARNLGLNIIWVDEYSEIPVFMRRLVDG
jgi:hypothetical protein